MWLCPKKTTACLRVGEQLVVAVGGLRHEGEHVVVGRRMAHQRPSSDPTAGRSNSALDPLAAELAAAVLDRRCSRSSSGASEGSSSQRSVLPADPRAVSLSSRFTHSSGKAPGEGVVAAEHELVRARGAGVGDHRLERREVAVDVVEQGAHGPPPATTAALARGGPRRARERGQHQARVALRAHLVALVRAPSAREGRAAARRSRRPPRSRPRRPRPGSTPARAPGGPEAPRPRAG